MTRGGPAIAILRKTILTQWNFSGSINLKQEEAVCLEHMKGKVIWQVFGSMELLSRQFILRPAYVLDAWQCDSMYSASKSCLQLAFKQKELANPDKFFI